MTRYAKGSRAERELLHILMEKGWAVIRNAGSGVGGSGPDLVSVKNEVCMVFECKSWDRGSLSLEPEQYMKLLEWEKNSTSNTFVAWKISYKGWYFIRMDEFTKGERNYNVTMKKVLEINRVLESILPKQAANDAASIPEPADSGMIGLV